MGDVLLEGVFQQFPQCKTLYDVRLTRTHLLVDEHGGTTFRRRPLGIKSVALSDVLNVKILESKLERDTSAIMQIICFVKDRKSCKRVRQDVSFRVMEGSGEDNMLTAELWSRTMLWLIDEPLIDFMDLQAKETFPPNQRYLVLINPVSGKGKSYSLYKKEVEPILKAAGVDYEEIVTDYAGQGHEIAKNLDLDRYKCIMICSGDGLGHEVINGFMKRYDWEVAVKTPLAFIPTGSGNACCYSVLIASGEQYDIISATFVALRGKPRPLNMCSYEIYNRKVYSFLSLSWGLLATVDIATEKMRALGSLRFTIGAVHQILLNNAYKGRLCYLPYITDQTPTGNQGNNQVSPRSSGTRLDDLRNDEVSNVRTTVATLSQEDASPTLQTPDSFKLTSVGMNDGEKVFNGRVAASEECPVSPAMQEQLEYVDPSRGPLNDLLPNALDNAPDDWHILTGEFSTVLVTMLSHIGDGLGFAPGMSLCEDFMYLVYVKGGVSRQRLLGMFLALEKGNHFKYSELNIIKVRAVRLEPDLATVGYISVDGELVEYGCVQGQLHKGLIQVCSLEQTVMNA